MNMTVWEIKESKMNENVRKQNEIMKSESARLGGVSYLSIDTPELRKLKKEYVALYNQDN